MLNKSINLYSSTPPPPPQQQQQQQQRNYTDSFEVYNATKANYFR